MTEEQRPENGSFGDRLARAVAARSSQLVVGLDPDPAALWPRAYELTDDRDEDPARRAAFAVAAHCALVIEAVAEQALAVKLQVACFERLGPPGWAALQEAARRAREHQLLVLVDAKRGDIDLTAAAYGQAFFGSTPSPYGEVEGVGADALTVNPLLGADALAPLVQAARDVVGGVFVLVRTSNPGAADIQDRVLNTGLSVSEHIAGLVDELGRSGVGSSGLSDVGAVVGATAPERLRKLRELMPSAVFLLPGVGAQGGRVEALAAALGRDPASILITASRAIVGAHAETGSSVGVGSRAETGARGATGASAAQDAARDAAGRLREAAWALRA